MINTSVNKNEHTIQSGVVDYPIGFPFYFNPDRTPQLLVKIGDEELRFNHNFELSEDRGAVVLRPTEEESWTLEGPEDFSWMAKWDGKDLLIERVVPFVQDSDYQLGRISSEQIERDFDLSVMRDQALDGKIKKLRNDMDDEFAAVDSRFDFVQEQTDKELYEVRDEFAEADKGLSNKIDETKVELQKSIDDKLPLAGGTLTGQIEIETSESDKRVLTFRASNGVSHTIYADQNGVQMPFKMHSVRNITPAGVRQFELGDFLNTWKTVYTTSLSAGGFDKSITIPEKAGTMALLEDMPDTYTKAEIDAKLSSVYKFKGSVANVDALPTGATVGDTYNVEDTGDNYAWDGSAWDKLAGTFDVSNYYTIDEIDEQYADLVEYVDKQTRPIKSDIIQLTTNINTVAEWVRGPKDENGNRTALETEAQNAYAAINELNAKIGEGGGGAEIGPELDVELKLTSWFYGFNSSDGYFYFDNIYSTESPEDVSCFALTNQVYSGTPNISIVNRSYGIAEDGQHYSFTEEWFGPGEYWPKNLGRDNAPWQTVYATKLNNGADLELPTEGGTLARLEDLEGLGGGDYLPLSGGTLSGELGLKFPGKTYETKIYMAENGVLHFQSAYEVRFYKSLFPNSSTAYNAPTLGLYSNPWKEGYISKLRTQTLTNGADLAVPTEGGTLARVEDITAAVGDISTALTAILGE